MTGPGVTVPADYGADRGALCLVELPEEEAATPDPCDFEHYLA
jgi:hypothetical protein